MCTIYKKILHTYFVCNQYVKNVTTRDGLPYPSTREIVYGRTRFDRTSAKKQDSLDESSLVHRVGGAGRFISPLIDTARRNTPPAGNTSAPGTFICIPQRVHACEHHERSIIVPREFPLRFICAPPHGTAMTTPTGYRSTRVSRRKCPNDDVSRRRS